MNDKEHYRKQYLELKDKLGKQPTSKAFYNEFNIDINKFGKTFGRNAFSKLVSECGDKPNIFGIPKTPLEDILVKWGKLTRELKDIL